MLILKTIRIGFFDLFPFTRVNEFKGPGTTQNSTRPTIQDRQERTYLREGLAPHDNDTVAWKVVTPPLYSPSWFLRKFSFFGFFEVGLLCTEVVCLCPLSIWLLEKLARILLMRICLPSTITLQRGKLASASVLVELAVWEVGVSPAQEGGGEISGGRKVAWTKFVEGIFRNYFPPF